MTTIRVEFSESVIGDLLAVRAWYREQQVAAIGERLVTEIFEHVESLAAYSDLGREVPEFGQPRLRELIHPPFRIVYKREARLVRVVRVWRSERLLQLPDDK